MLPTCSSRVVVVDRPLVLLHRLTANCSHEVFGFSRMTSPSCYLRRPSRESSVIPTDFQKCQQPAVSLRRLMLPSSTIPTSFQIPHQPLHRFWGNGFSLTGAFSSRFCAGPRRRAVTTAPATVTSVSLPTCSTPSDDIWFSETFTISRRSVAGTFAAMCSVVHHLCSGWLGMSRTNEPNECAHNVCG